MSQGVDEPDQPNRMFPAHYGVAIVAAVGAVAVQFAWPVISRREPAASWWPVDALLLIAATGYLACTGWLHLKSATWRPRDLGARLSRLVAALVADLVVALMALILFWQGPESNLLRAGLWIVLPALLATILAATPVNGLAIRSALRHYRRDVLPSDDLPARSKTSALLTIFTLLLIVMLYAIERYEPQVKPWEQPSAAAGE